MSHFGVPHSLGENPFPEVDQRHAKWEEFSAVNRKGVSHLISGLHDLQHVVDETTYTQWRVRHPEAPEAYDPDQVASWLGRDGLLLIRTRFDTIAVEAVDQFIQGPDDLQHARMIVENLATAMRLTFGGPGIIDCDAWKERKMRLVSDLIENINLPPRRWRIDPYDRDRLEEKRATPLIVRLMKACGTEFEHDRQAVDACFDLLCREGLSADKENILFLGNALTTLCERLEIEALSNRRSEEATLFAKLQVQFKKLADDGLGESRAERLPLTRSNGAPSHAPASGRGSKPAEEPRRPIKVPRRTPDLKKSRDRLVFLESVATELATIKQDLNGHCTAKGLKTKHPRFVVWKHLSKQELQEIVEGEQFWPKAFAENLTLRKFGITSRSTLKKDRQKIKRAEKGI